MTTKEKIDRTYEIAVRLDTALNHHLETTCPRHEKEMETLRDRTDWLIGKICVFAGVVFALGWIIERFIK